MAKKILIIANKIVFPSLDGGALAIQELVKNLSYKKYMIDLVESYGERNSTRLNAYHRLDIGLTHHKQKKYYERIISFGAYNAYNRKNPFFAYLSHDENGDRVAKQVSLFPIIPSISLRYKL